MKKSTIISIAIILGGVLNLSSCREDDIDQMAKSNTSIMEKHKKNQVMKNTQDSITVNTLSNSEENGSTLADPPPKDRGQW